MASIGDEELLAEMRSALDAVQTASDRARRQVQEARTTVRDKDHLLSVTVGGIGELRELTFHGDAYRELAPAELAALIVTTTTGAREDVRWRHDDDTGSGSQWGCRWVERCCWPASPRGSRRSRARRHRPGRSSTSSPRRTAPACRAP